MIELQRILVPTDFSEYSLKALKYAVAFAEKFGAELCVLHVIQDATLFIPEAVTLSPTVAPPVEEYKEEALRSVEQWIEVHDVRSRCTVASLVAEGAPSEEIVRIAGERDVDLVVMGTHGRTGLSRFFMGSEAEHVVREARCPVLTVHHPEHEFVKEDENQSAIP